MNPHPTNAPPPRPPAGFHAQLLDAIGQAVMATDLGGTLTYWNRAAEALYGWSAAEVVGRNILEVTPAEPVREEAGAIMDRLRAGQSWTGEFLVRRRDGSAFLAQVTNTPIVDDTGALAGVIGISSDLSAQQEARREVEVERARLKSVFEHAPAFMYVLRGPDHVIEMANPAFHAFTGLYDVVGRPVQETMPEDEGQGYLALLDEVYRTGKPVSGSEMPLRYCPAPGAAPVTRYVNVVYQPLHEPDGATTGILVHGVDVTEQVKARQAVQRASRLNQRIMDRSLDVICTADREGRLVQVSAASRRIWGYPPDALVGRRYRDLLHPKDVDKAEEAVRSLLRGAEQLNMENRMVRRDGRIVDMMWSATWSEDDQLLFAVGRDVTEMKAKERALAARREALRRSELRFRSLAETTAMSVWTADEAGVIWEMSEAWWRYTGQDPEAPGPPAETFHPDDLERSMAKWMAHVAAKTPFENEVRFRRADGAYEWFLARAVPVFDEDGTFVEWVGAATNIHDRKQAEAALRRSEAHYRTIVDTAHEGVVLVDAAARTTFVNARMAGVLGFTPEEMVGRSVYDFVDEADQAVIAQALAQPAGDAGGTYDLRYRRRDGTTGWALLSASPFFDESGTYTGWLGMVTDITDRKRAEQELLHAKEQAEEMARLKSSFLQNMSHEIRTPLTAIIGFAEALHDELTGQHRDYVDLIATGADRLMETLNSVLDLAQLDSGSLNLKPAPLNLTSVAMDTLRFFQKQAARKGLTLSLRAPDDLQMKADRGALLRVLNNLVSNAIKFTAAGSVTVVVERLGDDVVLSVVDTGVGISPAFLPRLFDDFEQESAGESRHYEGTGLGLPITKRLVEMMGGRIEVESAKDRGSVFRVVLPLVP